MASEAARETKLADVAPEPGATPPTVELKTGTVHVAGDAHGAKSGLPQLDATTFASQLFWLAVTFALLYVVLSRLAVPRISGVLAARENRIKGDIERAALAKRDSEAAIAAYEKALADARGRALKLADEIRRAVQAEADNRNAGAAQQLAADMAKAERRIGEMRKGAMARIGDVARESAAEIVVKLTGEAASGGDLEAAVRSALRRA